MAAVEEGKCAFVVPPPPGSDRLFVLVLFARSRFPLFNLLVFHGAHTSPQSTASCVKGLTEE